MAGLAKSTRVELAALCALTLLALPLRCSGLDFLLPASVEGDGGVIVRQVDMLEDSPDPSTDPTWSYYPHLVAIAVSTFTRQRPLPSAQQDVEAHLAAASDTNVRVRRVVACISILLVPATWWIARRLVSRRAALFAAAAVAASQLVLCLAQEARPHAAAATFATLAVASALRLRALPSPSSYLLAGIAAAAAIGTLQSGVAVLLPLVAAHVLRDRARPVRGWSSLAALAGCVLPIALAVGWLYPLRALAAGPPDIHVVPQGSTRFFGHVVPLDQIGWRGFEIVWETLVSFEPALLALALLGLAAWLVAGGRGRRRLSPELLVALAYFVPYLVVIGIYEGTYERFVIQLVPGVACVAAFGLDRPWSSPSRAWQWLGHGLALAALLVSGTSAIRLVRLRQLPDTSARAAAWIAENVAGDERIALLPYIDLPLVRGSQALDDLAGLGVLSPWLDHQLQNRARLPAEPRFDLRTPRVRRRKESDAVLADPIAYLRASGAQWAVVPAAETEWPGHDGVHRALLERAVLAASIPEGAGLERVGAASDPTRPPLDVGDSSRWWRGNWTWSLLRGDAIVGKVLHVFRLDDGPSSPGGTSQPLRGR